MNISIDNYKDVFSKITFQLSSLDNIGDKSIKSIITSIKDSIYGIYDGGKQLESQNNILKIGVVGQVKAGKSSFLNSLFFDGESVLPRASTPMTAGLTVLKYDDSNHFETEYYNSQEWKVFVDKDCEYNSMLQELKSIEPMASDVELISRYNVPEDLISAHQLVSKCSRRAIDKIRPEALKETMSFSGIKELQSTLDTYVGADGTFTPITKCLTIYLNDERLKGIEVVDTPGVNDPVLSRELRTREFLRGCHGVFFLSYSGRFFDSTDVSFLINRIGSQGIGSVVLIASKFDSVLQDVGIKFRDDLGNAIEDCEKKLKGQYYNNIRKSSFQGKDPILDFCSGIGYSIFKKEFGSLDQMESHVVSQMQSFYPSFFDGEKETKKMFGDLSNIDDIRSKYLEGVFSKNKELIIKDKVNSYFFNTNNTIKEKLIKEEAKLQEIIDILKNNDIKTITQHKAVAEKVIKEITSDINSIVNRSEDLADRCMKECLNSFTFRWSGKVPTTNETCTLIRTSTFWGSDKTFTHTYDKVDLCQLQEELDRHLDESLKIVSEAWRLNNKDIYDSILKCISDTIAKNEREDESGCFNGHILRNVLDEIIEKMRNNSTLDVASVKNEFHNTMVNTLTGADNIKYVKSEGKEEIARSAVDKAAHDCIDNVRLIVTRQVSGVQSGVRDLLNNAKATSISVLKERKDLFISEIADNFELKLHELEDSIINKTKTLDEATSAYDIINKLKEQL